MDDQKIDFRDIGLDERILEAIASLKWQQPTLIQEKAIPLVLEGKDVLARAKTGSGKTAAFVIPVVQQILQQKLFSPERETTVLVLAPTQDLCKQIHRNFCELTHYCRKEVCCYNVSPEVNLEAQRPLLFEKPDVVIGTPKPILAHLQNENLCIKESLKVLVVDEADLIFDFSNKEEISDILDYLPEIHQSILMSATLTEKVKDVKKLLLHNPVVLKLEEPELPESDKLTQYYVKCEDDDKFTLIYSLFKLELIRGKTLIFVDSVARCCKLKLFLQQFGIKSCVLNSELPAISRCHAVNQFNDGIYNIIIASDEQVADKPAASKKNKKKRKGKEYGISRGIDFQLISNVINFDFPETVNSYIHRVGRTARGTESGTALSFVSIKEQDYLKQVEDYFTDPQTGESTSNLKPYVFNMDELESFRYRATDAYHAVNKNAIAKARLEEIRRELLNSKSLKAYFEDNPRDFQVLNHDKKLHALSLGSHLKHVPDYIVPPTLKGIKLHEEVAHDKGTRSRRGRGLEPKSSKKYRKKHKDPLHTFQFKGDGKFKGKHSRKRKLDM